MTYRFFEWADGDFVTASRLNQMDANLRASRSRIDRKLLGVLHGGPFTRQVGDAAPGGFDVTLTVNSIDQDNGGLYRSAFETDLSDRSGWVRLPSWNINALVGDGDNLLTVTIDVRYRAGVDPIVAEDRVIPLPNELATVRYTKLTAIVAASDGIWAYTDGQSYRGICYTVALWAHWQEWADTWSSIDEEPS